jgi:maltoporin
MCRVRLRPPRTVTVGVAERNVARSRADRAHIALACPRPIARLAPGMARLVAPSLLALALATPVAAQPAEQPIVDPWHRPDDAGPTTADAEPTTADAEPTTADGSTADGSTPDVVVHTPAVGTPFVGPLTPTPPAALDDTGFRFGSYGRIAAGSDLHGGRPSPIAIVAHAPRIVERDYVELDLRYRLRPASGGALTTVVTLGFGDRLFHQTGAFDAATAIRNLYLEGERALAGGTASLWVGSRMYRGDDLYLLDYWPLDDVNTVGAGLGWRRDRLGAATHVGWNRLDDPFQYQERDVFTPDDGTVTIPELDRQRWIATAQTDYRVWGDGVGPSAKVKGYAEVTGLPAGERTRADDTTERLPSDRGVALGVEAGAWGLADGQTHANLFLRYARGLSAYDELEVPTDLAADKRTWPDASELVIGAGGNLDLAWGGGQAAAYARRFVDGDPVGEDRDDGWEAALVARPRVLLHRDVQAALDLSWQVRFPRGLDPVELAAMDPAVFQLAPMLVYAPWGPHGYDRPQFRFVYRAAHLNAAARSDLYPLEDPRRDRTWAHSVGVQAEWWFNSAYR